jgi:hypothetical protein
MSGAKPPAGAPAVAGGNLSDDRRALPGANVHAACQIKIQIFEIQAF